MGNCVWFSPYWRLGPVVKVALNLAFQFVSDTNESIPNNQRQPSTSSPNHAVRTAVTMSSIELPPYAPPKKTDAETIAPCEPPPPYTPQEISFV